MKRFFTIFPLTLMCITAMAQDKKSNVNYSSLIEIKGTEFVIARAEHWSKRGGNTNNLLFINTRTGEQRKIEIPLISYNDKIEQVRIEKLNLNIVLVSTKVLDLNGKEGIDYGDPRQLIAFSPDGLQRTQITEDRFYVGSWTLNTETGRIVITGRFDSNGNGKLDVADEARIVLYDLTTMKPVFGT